MKLESDRDALLAQSAKRLHPSLTDPNWLILRARRQLFERWIARIPGNRLRVLDVGGRLQPYRPLLAGRVEQYYAVDRVPGPLVNVVAGVEQLPFAGDSFDVLICTQVLEYVPHPRIAIDEMHRVLKPGGSLLLSVPSVFPRDSEPEYWRFLPSALRLMLGGFAQLEIAAEGSSVAGIFRTLNVYTYCFSPGWIRTALGWSTIPALNLAGHLAETVIGSHSDHFSANFSVWARK